MEATSLPGGVGNGGGGCDRLAPAEPAQEVNKISCDESTGKSDARAEVTIDVASDPTAIPAESSMQPGASSGTLGQEDEEAPTVHVRVFQVSFAVRAGGVLLALCAGTVNAVAFHALSSFVSHQTGSITKAGLGLEAGERADALDSVLLILAFTCGSMVCGFLIGKNTIHFGLALYDMCLLTEAGLLVAATFTSEHRCARYFASAACGLQNGMATHWGGAVIRTTHVTGLFTDVGLLVGRIASMLARKRCGRHFDLLDQVQAADDLSKLSVLLSIAAAFFVGVIAGAFLFNHLQEHAFLIPAAVVFFAGMAYLVYRVFVLHQRLFSDAEMECVDVSRAEVAEDPPDAAHGHGPRRYSLTSNDSHDRIMCHDRLASKEKSSSKDCIPRHDSTERQTPGDSKTADARTKSNSPAKECMSRQNSDRLRVDVSGLRQASKGDSEVVLTLASRHSPGKPYIAQNNFSSETSNHVVSIDRPVASKSSPPRNSPRSVT